MRASRRALLFGYPDTEQVEERSSFGRAEQAGRRRRPGPASAFALPSKRPSAWAQLSGGRFDLVAPGSASHTLDGIGPIDLRQEGVERFFSGNQVTLRT